MGWYVLKRTIWAVIASFAILTVAFVLLWVTPDPQLASIQRT
jgi:hypothetical protein